MTHSDYPELAKLSKQEYIEEMLLSSEDLYTAVVSACRIITLEDCDEIQTIIDRIKALILSRPKND